MVRFDPETSIPAQEMTSEAVGIYDSFDRLVAYNDRYATLRSAIGGDIELGVLWNDLVTASVQSGGIPESIGREAQWLEWRRRTRGAYSMIRQVPDGRSFQVNERRTPNGGIAVIWTDITQLVQRGRMVDRRLAQLLAMMRNAPLRDADTEGLSYDPDELTLDADWWRELAAHADPLHRRMCLHRAAKCEELVRRSTQTPPVADRRSGWRPPD
jgi:hypothetical protein